MRKYLVNSTYCVYLLDLRELYFDESIVTINNVVEEVKHERGVVIEAPLIPIKKTSVGGKTDLLSNTDLALLQTAKVMNYILVTDDKNLIKAAHHNSVQTIDTPHFMHRLLMENKWSEEKTINILNRLKSIHNRIYIIEKVIKDIKNWG